MTLKVKKVYDDLTSKENHHGFVWQENAIRGPHTACRLYISCDCYMRLLFFVHKLPVRSSDKLFISLSYVDPVS
jgi:hypothetical protein